MLPASFYKDSKTGIGIEAKPPKGRYPTDSSINFVDLFPSCLSGVLWSLAQFLQETLLLP
jgi:hypothetical protein